MGVEVFAQWPFVSLGLHVSCSEYFTVKIGHEADFFVFCPLLY